MNIDFADRKLTEINSQLAEKGANRQLLEEKQKWQTAIADRTNRLQRLEEVRQWEAEQKAKVEEREDVQKHELEKIRLN